MQKPDYSPWWAIIVMLIVFFPVGLMMLIYQVLKEKRWIIQNGRMMRVLGVISVPLGAMGFVLTFVSGADDQIAAVFLFGFPAAVLVVFGAAMLIWGGALHRRGSMYNCYLKFLLLNSERSIPAIAQVMGVNTMRAMESLEQMVDMGLLRDAYVDHGRQMLMSKETAQYALRCKHCGGTSLLTVGKPVVCSYCGAAL